MLRSELTNKFTFFFPCSELSSHHFRQQFFCFNQRYLYVSVRVAIQRQLTCNAFGQAGIDSRIFRRQFADDIITLVRFLNLREFLSIGSKEVVQLSDQTFHSRDEFNQTFRNQNCTEVVALSSAVGYYLCNVSYDIVQRHIFCLNFF